MYAYTSVFADIGDPAVSFRHFDTTANLGAITYIKAMIAASHFQYLGEFNVITFAVNPTALIIYIPIGTIRRGYFNIAFAVIDGYLAFRQASF